MNKIITYYKSIKNQYVVQVRRPYEYIMNKYYAHLIDPFFTKLAFDLKLTPNIVTLIAGILGLSTALCIFLDQLLLAAVLLQLHHFLDGADGNLARLTNNCSEFGAKLDQWFDQVVRFALFLSIAWVSEVSIWIKILFMTTIYIDLLVIHKYVLPFIKKNQVIRSKWKEWFMSKGIIPAFDIFLIYFLISLFSIIGNLELLVYIILVGKNADWIYRVWECVKTKYYYKKA
ncbi:CDP-alcohol phosphatidyltransferase family protein [Gracilibacillus lacisalsi]|uniref:CDP-alcohol phosphatidyltransferase family protein n=1 Tax=Gracilibacillus lacisalsi TaxID=393087 RepID=UPI00039F5CFE|nr:CDP-alcohol phosphatidyltransferase family protein [Gracilibacillus lacisalsi]